MKSNNMFAAHIGIRFIGICISVFLLSGFTSAVADDTDSYSTKFADQALDHYLTGSIHEETGDLIQAALEYQVAHIYDSTSAAISVALAKTYLRLGYSAPAIMVLEAGRRNNHGDLELLDILAEGYTAQGRLELAISCYDEMEEVAPLEESDLLHCAALATTVKDIDKALELYRQYTDRFGMDAVIYEKIGLLHLTRRDIAAAETTFVRLIELDPQEYRILFVLGGFAVAKQDWPTGEGYFRRALEGDSTNARFWSNLIMTLAEQGKDDEAMSVIDEAIEKFPEVAQFPDIRASVYEQLGQLDEALICLDNSIELDTSRLSPYLSKGFILQRLERWDDAALTYDLALNINAENPTVLNNYAYMLSEQSYRLEDALSMVDYALELRPETPSFLDTKGWINYRLGRFKEGLNLIKKALKSDPDNAELYYHLGYVYEAIGKKSKAKKAWRKAAKLEPDNIEYLELAN